MSSKRRTQGDWLPNGSTYFAAGRGPTADTVVENRRRAQRCVSFAAGDVGWASVPQYYLVAANDLFGAAGDKRIEELLSRDLCLLLDSGIFNLTNEHMRATGCSMDEALRLAPEQFDGFDALFDRYVELATRYGDRLWGYIELDQGGAENKRKTRARLHELGLDPIPVYHPLVDGWDYFDELAQSYERICLGNIVQATMATRVRLLHTMWERRRAYPELWMHVLGLTPNDTCLPFVPDSCDSSTWMSGLRWPSVNLGASMLTSLGNNTDPAFRYAPRSPDHSSAAELVRDSRPNEPGYFAAVGVYADEVDFTTWVWRRIKADRASELGESEYPVYLVGEGQLCPARP